VDNSSASFTSAGVNPQALIFAHGCKRIGHDDHIVNGHALLQSGAKLCE